MINYYILYKYYYYLNFYLKFMDILIEDNKVRVVTERNDLTVELEYTPEIKNFILAVYQAGRDKERIDFTTAVISTTVEQN